MEKWTTQTRLDGSLRGSITLTGFTLRLYYGYEPEDHCYHLLVNGHTKLRIYGIEQSHFYLQVRLLTLAREWLLQSLQEIGALEYADFAETQEDVGEEQDTGVELRMGHVLEEMDFLAKDTARIMRKGKKKMLDEGYRDLLVDYISCYVAYSEAKQKLLKGERAFVPWYHYRVD